jgi:beta-lactamase superfamily II metal-dependent hydrolase
MNITTVNVGQGALAIVRHNKEALIVDSSIPPSTVQNVAHVKQILAAALKGHYVKGLILTGLDSDHTDVIGASIILQKYRPDWVVYPGCHKETLEATLFFKLVDEQVDDRRDSARPLTRIGVRLDKLPSRRLTGLSQNFDFELFSPHVDDMTSSNNSSIVLKITGIGAGGFSYLITGDTETDRWKVISDLFGSSLKSHVLAAAHHGSINGVHAASLLQIEPHTVHISAGIDNQYGHPHPAALRAYKLVAKEVFATSMNGGVSILTQPGQRELSTTLIPHSV